MYCLKAVLIKNTRPIREKEIEMLIKLTKRFLAFAALSVALSGVAIAQSSPMKMKIQTGVPSASIYFELMKNFGERVDKMSNGRMKVEVLPDGAVVGAFGILDAVDKGVVDGGFAWTHYWSGKNSAAALFSNPASGSGVGLDQVSHMSWLKNGGGDQLYDRLFTEVLKTNIKPFMIQPMGPDPFGWFKKPINSINDMKSMKYRSPPGLTAEIFKEMGLTTVAMPGAEIVPAAQRGVIDAAEWIGPADDMILGFQNVFKHYYLQGLHQSTDVAELLINKTYWDKLPADLKAIIETAVAATIAETYTFNVYRNAVALEKLKKDHGVTIHNTPKEFFTAFQKATSVVYTRESEKNPFFKEVLDSQRKFAGVVVPYWTQINELYYNIGATAVGNKSK
jgi:TRAP-type mannitol/chloroaromatic compound transport system substrate-binding protein